MNYLFVTPVWGKAFLEAFLETVLPCYMAESNLGHLAKGNRVIYRIYTKQEDAEFVLDHPAYQILSGIVETQICCHEYVPPAYLG